MSRGLSKELKHRGFSFCGPVIVYAFAQATGMVNDHLTTCFRHEECAEDRPQIILPELPRAHRGFASLEALGRGLTRFRPCR